MPSIGLLGIGLLGTALAHRLIQAGFHLVGFDLLSPRREAFRALGGEPVDSPVLVAQRCDRLVLSLPDSTVVARLLDDLESHLRPGMLLLDTTTGDPDQMCALGLRLAARHIDYLDACIVGSSDQARTGDVLLLLGGHPSTIARHTDLLDCLTLARFCLGEPGAGARTKLVVNLVLGLHRAVLAEALSLAAASGLDPARTLEVLRAGAAYSRVMDTKGDRMLHRDFAPQARLRQHLKDVDLILAQAARAGIEIPLSLTHHELLERVVALGGGDQDNSAILRAYDRP